jgi:proteasome beta subunit
VRFRDCYAGSSFLELLDVDHSHMRVDFADLARRVTGLADAGLQAPHGTTVLALKFVDGVLVAGDRLATEGYRVASRDVEKVFATDGHSLIAIAGAAGPAIEMARLLRIELEHYEKIEGEALELEGKANKLSQMIRQNLPAAMQGLVVVPIFAGYDVRRKTGRLWKYDVTGGRYEEADFETTGSGGLYAKDTLKKRGHPGLSRAEALCIAIEALMDAADEDRATGGVDLARGIFPVVKICTASGIEDVAETEIAEAHRSLVAARGERGAK